MNDADAKASKAEKIRRDASLPMSDIQSNPITALGYKKLKDPKTGIVKVGDVDDFEERGSYNPVKNKMALNSVTLRNKPKLRDDVAKHELGHTASHALNPEPQQSTSHASKARATNKELETLRDKEENRQRRLDLTHSKDRTHRAAASSWSSNMHDRDQIALDKDNESLKNKARKTLYKAYGAPDRATMSDRDLGKTATGTIIPEETYMTIKERFYANLDLIREEAEQLDELRGYRKKKLFGKDPLVAVANRAINRMKLPPHKGKLSPEELKSNRKNRKVSQMAFDRMPD